MGVHSLETALVVALDLPRHVSQQTLEHINTGEVVDKAGVLRFALLKEVILVENGFQRDILFVQERVDGGRIMKPEPADRLDEDSSADKCDRCTSKTCRVSTIPRPQGCWVVPSQTSGNVA